MEFGEVPNGDGDTNNNNTFDIEMKEIEENENKIIIKIKIQEEEIKKTKILLTQIENCYEAQEQMLNKFFAKQLEIKNRKLELLSSYENNQNNSVDLTTVGENNSNCLIGECENLIQNKDLKRKHTTDNEEIEIKEKRLNKEHFEWESTELKNYSQTVYKDSYKPKFISKLPNNVTINKMSMSKNTVYFCGSDGFIAEFYTRAPIIKELLANSNENIIDMVRIKDKLFAFTVNSMILINPQSSASVIKVFYSNIGRSVHLRGYMIFIPLQDGTVWQFDYQTNSIRQFYQGSFIFTNFFCIKKDFNMMLVNDSVIALYQNKQRTVVKTGCRNIDIYDDTSLICTFEKKIWIVNLQSEKTIFKRYFSDCIILLKATKYVLVVLDSKNKLHIFRTERKYEFEYLAVIQLPVDHKIGAILPIMFNEIIFSTDEAIYEINI